MSSIRTLMITSIILTPIMTQAITVSTGAFASNQNLALKTRMRYTPSRHRVVGEESTALSYGVILSPEHRVPMQTGGIFLRGEDMFDKLFGFFGEAGIGHSIDGEQLFADASLLLTPNSVTPYVSGGGYYATQSGSQIAVGARITRLTFDLESKSDGALFNGWSTNKASQISANMVDVLVDISNPINDTISIFASASYGLQLMSTTLPVAELNNATIDNAALMANQNTNLELGNQYGENIDLYGNQLSIGARINITQI